MLAFGLCRTADSSQNSIPLETFRKVSEQTLTCQVFCTVTSYFQVLLSNWRLIQWLERDLVASIPKENIAYVGSASNYTPQLLPVISSTKETACFWCDVMLTMLKSLNGRSARSPSQTPAHPIQLLICCPNSFPLARHWANI